MNVKHELSVFISVVSLLATEPIWQCVTFKWLFSAIYFLSYSQVRLFVPMIWQNVSHFSFQLFIFWPLLFYILVCFRELFIWFITYFPRLGWYKYGFFCRRWRTNKYKQIHKSFVILWSTSNLKLVHKEFFHSAKIKQSTSIIFVNI